MSKTVKLEDRIYNQLERVLDKRETFSGAVERLLAARDEFLEIARILEGKEAFEEWKRTSKGG